MPDHWQHTTLGEVADYKNGYPFKPADLAGSGLPVIRIRQLLDRSEVPDRTDIELPAKHLIDDGDIVFSWSATLAVRTWDRGPAVLNQHLFRVDPREGIEHRWLAATLDHAIDDLAEKSHGTTMKHITKRALSAHPVLVPPVVEQRRIVDVIASIDEYIEALDAEITATRNARNALLSELLSNPGDDWRSTTVADITGHQIGGVWGSDPGGDEIDVPVFRQTEFDDYGNLLQPAGAIRSVTTRQLSSRTLQQGDVLIQKSAGTPTLPGRVVYVPALSEVSTFSNFLTLLRPDQRVTQPKFYFLLLQHLHFSGAAFEFQRGTNIRNLDLRTYLATAVQLPPLRDQTHIVEIVESMDNQFEALKSQIESTRTFRSGVLSELLSGERLLDESYDVAVGL